MMKSTARAYAALIRFRMSKSLFVGFGKEGHSLPGLSENIGAQGSAGNSRNTLNFHGPLSGYSASLPLQYSGCMHGRRKQRPKGLKGHFPILSPVAHDWRLVWFSVLHATQYCTINKFKQDRILFIAPWSTDFVLRKVS
ncbi:hypothetical protein [Agrobacterium vitis]|uniref:hypothetical protein n=1 Tax=Agrobacterium vitis TaxID=373 RepID=UPI0012E91D16|nr:hypothetical protein [Agrobacterium vitis]MUZ65311.1 hypothetical protein [Agrobacterium vitis]